MQAMPVEIVVILPLCEMEPVLSAIRVEPQRGVRKELQDNWIHIVLRAPLREDGELGEAIQKFL